MKKTRKQKKACKQMDNYLLESNKEFHDDFVQTHYSPAKKSRRKLWLWGGATALVVICIVCLIVFLPTADKPDTPPPRYLLENERTVHSTIEELNKNIKNNIIVTDTNSYTIDVKKFYDNVSKDTLYFQLDMKEKNGFEKISIYFYSNPYYNSNRTIGDNMGAVSHLNRVPLLYNHLCKEQSEGVYHHTVVAQSQQKDFYLYVEFCQISAKEQTTFFTFIQALVQTK